MVKETGKKKSELSYRKRLSELQAAAERAKSAYKWEQAILMHSQALALIDDFLSKTPVQAFAKRNQYLIDRFEALEQRRICYRDSGSLTGEEADLTEMAALAEKISDAARQTRVMSAQAHLFWITGCIDEAREVNKKALTQARRLRDRQQEADSLVTLGLLNWRSSEQAFSKSYVEKALELYRELGNLSGEANALRALGMVIYELGEHTRCQECYRRSLEIFRQLGDRLGEGNVLNNMQIASTDLAQRRDLCEQALATFEATGNLERLSMMYNNIGFEYTFLGLYKRALDYLQHSYELAGQIKSPFQLAYSLSSLGTAYLGLGDTQKARLFIERSLSAAQEIKDNPLESGELLELGRLELMEGHPGEALLAFQTACQILQKYESHEQASALAWQGAAYLMSGELEAAQQATSQAVKAFEELGPPNENLPQEVWWWRYRCLSEAQLGSKSTKVAEENGWIASDETWQDLDRARETMLSFITTLSDDGLRRNYFNKVNINRQIVQEWFVQARMRKAQLDPLTDALVRPASGQDQFRRLLDIGVRLNERGEGMDLPNFIVDQVIELSGAEKAIFYLVDEGGKTQVVAEYIPSYFRGEVISDERREQYLSEVILKRVSLLLYTPEEAESLDQQSILCIPLIASGKLMGLFYCELAGIYGRFTTQDRDLLLVLANQAAVAVENAHWTTSLEQRVAERTAELTIINSVGEAMARQLDVETITHIVGDKVRDIFQSEAVGILFFDPKTGMIQESYVYDRGYTQPMPPFPLGRGLTSVVIETRKPLVLGTLQEAKERGAILGSKGEEDQEETQSYMGVPIIVGERVIGVVNVQSYRPHAFDEASVRLLSTLSANMGVAIENARLFQAERQRAAELSIINSVQQGLASQLNMQAIYDLVGDKIREIFDAQVVMISSFDKKTNLIHFLYTYEKGERYYHEPIPCGIIAAHIIQTHESLRFDTPEQWDEWESNIVPGTEVTKSGVYVPLVVGSEVRGIISLQNIDRENAFSNTDVRLLETLANSMSVALENARLFQETQRLLAETEQRNSELAIINRVGMALARQLDPEAIVSLVGKQLSEVFTGQMCSIALYDKASDCIHWPYFAGFDGQQIPQQSVKLGPGLTSHVIHSRQPLVLGTLEEAKPYGAVWVYDQVEQEPKSWIGVPILVGDEAIGVLAVQDLPENRYSEIDVRLLATLAASMSVSLENARLFDETQRLLKESEQRAAELTTINTVSQALASELELDSLIQLIGEQMRLVFQADIVYVALHDLQTNLIRFPYVFGEELSPIPFGEGLTSKILETGKPLLINRGVEERAAELGASRVGMETRSYLGVPILAGKRSIGVISVQSVSHEGRFDESDVHLLSTIAANVGAAIQNARLYQETQRRAVEMAALAEIGSDIASTHEIEPVLERLAARTKDLMNVGDIALYLMQPDGETMRAVVALGKYTEEIKKSPLYLGVGISGSIAQSGIAEFVNYPERDQRVIHVPGTPDVEEELEGLMCAPLVSRGKVIGLMSVWRLRNLGLFTQSELDFLVSLARQAAIAIESARLYLETQRRADQMATIAEVGRELSATLDLQTVLESVANHVHRLFKARDTILRLMEPDEKNLRSVVTLGTYADIFKSDIVPLGDGITGLIAQSGVAEVIDDVARDPRGVHVSGTPDTEEEPETLMVAPLTARGRTIGTLSVYRNRREGLFTSVDLDFLVGLGRQAAIAIENASLFTEVQSQKSFSESLVQNSPVAIVTTDMEANVVSWNPGAEKLFGYTQMEAIGQNVDDLIACSEDLHAEAASYRSQATAGRMNAITRRFRKNGSLVDVELSGVSLKGDGQQSGIIAIYHDLTELKRAEEAILESERKMADIIDFLPDATLVIDQEGRVIAWNRAMEEMTEIIAEDMLGKGDYEYALPFYGERRPILVDLVFKPKEELESKYAHVQRQGSTLVGETYVSHLKGGGRYLLGTASMLHDSKGQIVGAIEIVRDITERKVIEDELRQAKAEADSANQAKSAFLAMMSHEIRTPMNAIIGMSGLLMDTPLNVEQRDFAETIRSSGDALLTIINDILDFSKIEAGKMDLEEQPFDLRECLEASLDLVKMRASENKLELAYQMEPEVPSTIVGDVTRLRQILINLLNNAVKFTEKGEVVLTVTGEIEPGEQPVSATASQPAQANYRLHFSVRDTGIGIPADRLNRLFQAFSQADASTSRRYGGTGLGLAISKRLCEMMGGEMWVESEGVPGKGATFHFTILARSAAELKARPHLQKEQPELRGKRLLVVDDNATNRRILSLQTKTWGMIARDTASPEEALSWLQKGDPFDLGILDMLMPEMEGPQLASEMRKLRDEKSMPLVLTSSLGRGESGVPEGLFAAYLMKPIRPSALFDTLMTLFASGTQRVEEAVPVQSRLDPEMASRHPLRILLAEDNVVNQKLALRLLSQMGYRADVAANGIEAIRSLNRQPYDVILMDVQMPEMDGLEASRQICAHWPRGSRPCIIAMTANAMQGDREICLEAGMDDYVSKPIRVDELVSALSKAKPLTRIEKSED